MWKYLGASGRHKGEYLSGVEARDLTDEEVAALPADRREAVEAGHVYRHEDDEPPPASSVAGPASTARRGAEKDAEKGGGN
jgi:hypothetical protein